MLRALELNAGGLSQEWSRREKSPSLNLPATLILIQSGVQLAFWTAIAQCRFVFGFSPTNALKSFSTGLLSIYSPPILYLCLGWCWLRRRTLWLALLNFMRFTHLSSLLRFLWLASLPSRLLTEPHALCCQQAYSGCTRSLCPCCQQRCWTAFVPTPILEKHNIFNFTTNHLFNSNYQGRIWKQFLFLFLF